MPSWSCPTCGVLNAEDLCDGCELDREGEIKRQAANVLRLKSELQSTEDALRALLGTPGETDTGRFSVAWRKFRSNYFDSRQFRTDNVGSDNPELQKILADYWREYDKDLIFVREVNQR